MYLFPSDLDAVGPSRADIDAKCLVAAEHDGDTYGEGYGPVLDCAAAFGFVAFASDGLTSYAEPRTFNAPHWPFPAGIPVVSRFDNSTIAANWSMLWAGNKLLQTLSTNLPYPAGYYALGIFENGTLSSSCANWQPYYAQTENTTIVDTRSVQPSELTSSKATMPCKDYYTTQPTVVFCVCIPPAPATASPTAMPSKAPTHHPTTERPTDSPTKSPTPLPSEAPTPHPTVEYEATLYATDVATQANALRSPSASGCRAATSATCSQQVGFSALKCEATYMLVACSSDANQNYNDTYPVPGVPYAAIAADAPVTGASGLFVAANWSSMWTQPLLNPIGLAMAGNASLVTPHAWMGVTTAGVGLPLGSTCTDWSSAAPLSPPVGAVANTRTTSSRNSSNAWFLYDKMTTGPTWEESSRGRGGRGVMLYGERFCTTT